jgi:Glycosyl hydrolase 108
MQSDFQRALEITLKYEGGYANHPNDPGGATQNGVTQRVYNKYRTMRRKPIRGVQHIARNELEDIYQSGYWIASGASSCEWPLSLAVFDLAVNSGAGRARQFLAEIGEVGTPRDRADRLMMRRRKFFLAIVAHNRRLAVFLQGWFSRCDQLEEAIATTRGVEAPGPIEGIKTLILNGQTFTAATVSVVGSKIYANGVKKSKVKS